MGNGSIPAWAGKPFTPTIAEGADVVYPRVGGETKDARLLANHLGGLSPRGRGNLRPARIRARIVGSIPAWAGKPNGYAHQRRTGYTVRSIPAWAGKPYSTRCAMLPSVCRRVYPRVGGETCPICGDSLSLIVRSIPAWAGKPRRPACPVLHALYRVYPRVGGETSLDWWTP